MKDIDFDELDKAVSSLMNQAKPSTSNDEASNQDDGVNVVTLPSYSDDTTPPKFVRANSASLQASDEKQSKTSADQPAVATVESSDSTKPSQSPANFSIGGRSGKFMDVKPPTRSNNQSSSSQRPRRQGITLQPMSAESPVQSDSQDTEPVLPNQTDTQDVASDTDRDTTASTPEATTWPDPIDMHEQLKADDGSTELDTQPELSIDSATPTEAEPEPETEETADSKPQLSAFTPINETPFLPGAKVEKRPLGVAQKTLSADDAPDETDTAVDEVTEGPETEPDTQNATAAIPDELHREVLSVEGNEVSPARPTLEASSDAARQKSVATTTTSPSKPSSISQQYKEKTSTDDSHDNEHAHIFDTASYQPLAHPAKKKSGWLVVIVIVLLLLIGAGGAAALYYFDLI